MAFRYVLYLFAMGWAMGIVYDIYNTLTGSSKWLRWLRPVLDIVFWCFSAVVVYYITFVTDDGRFRLYTFVLLVIGYALYKAILHHAVVSSAFAVFSAVRFVFMALFKVFYVLVLRPLSWIIRGLGIFAQGIYRLLCQLENLLVKLTMFWMKVFFFPLRPAWKHFGRNICEKFMDKWEGMCLRMSKKLKTWPPRHS